MTKPPPKIDDVAKASGVSTATISRYLNSPDIVAPKTAERIAAVIQKLGYTPNMGGRILAKKQRSTVGALIPTMSNSVFAVGIQSFQEELSKQGVTLLIGSTNYQQDNEFEQIKFLLSHGADGLLLVGNNRPKLTDEFLQARGVPTVSSWNIKPDSVRPNVGFNNCQASAELTRLVIEQGHKNIATVSGFLEGNDRASDRLQGVKQAIEHAGPEVNLIASVETKYSIDHGEKAFDFVMSYSPRPTAIIAGNDVLAAGLIVRAKALGLEIPKDVSVTGFDDIALARFIEPGLTTVRVPQREMGRLAAQVLLQEMHRPGSAKSIELQSLVVKRSSLGPVPVYD